MVSYKDCKSDCKFLLFVQLGDLISNKQKQHYYNLVNKYKLI